MDKYSEKILKRIREDYRKRRMDAKEEGKWRTTEEGDHIHFNEQGEIDKGNPYVVSAMSKSGTKTSTSMRESVEKARKSMEGRKKNSYETKQIKSDPEEAHGQGASKTALQKQSGGTAKKNEKAVMTTEMDKTDGGVSYPKPRNGAKWTDAIRVAQETATGEKGDEKPGKNGEPPMVEPGTWDKTIAKLSDKDIVYQKDSDGNEVACIPGLAAMADNKIKGSEKMRSIWEKAVADSKQVTTDMLDVAQKSGAYMYGLENCVKGASHFENKVQRLKNKGHDGTLEEIAERDMNDAVRFTAICDNDNVVSTVKSLCKELKNKGYEIVELENKFLNDDGTVNEDVPYRAVHIGVKSPEGRVMELQVHTPQSQNIKNMNHKEYDIQNDMEKKKPKSEWGDEEWKKYNELNDIMVQRWKDNYTNPPGIETLRSFGKKKKK